MVYSVLQGYVFRCILLSFFALDVPLWVIRLWLLELPNNDLER